MSEAEDSKPKPSIEEVFAALDAAEPLPDDFPYRDMSPAQERPELDKMFDALEREDAEPMTDEDREWMRREDWEPDYDDEPRSNGNFGLDPQLQEAVEAAKKQPGKMRARLPGCEDL